MDFGSLIRSPEHVHADLVQLPDQTLMTKSGCKIYFPARWTEQRLAFLGNETYVFGFFAIVVGTHYVVGRACTMFKLSPAYTKQVTIGDEVFYELGFDPGTTVVKNLNCVMDDTLPYQMYHEFIELGKLPSYQGYYDQANMFESCIALAGVKLGANEAVLSAIASSVLKDPDDLTRSYAFRLNLVSDGQQTSVPAPTVVPFRDVQYGATNTTAKIMGSYSDLAITSALVNPSERNEPFEDLLRE